MRALSAISALILSVAGLVVMASTASVEAAANPRPFEPAGAGASTACAPQPAGMVSWWRAELSTLDQTDGNTGILNNGAGFSSGKVGFGFNLDGVDDFVSAPDTANLSITGSLTIDAWIFLRAYPPEFAPVVSKWNDISGAFRSYFLAVNAAGQLEAQLSTNGLWNPGVGANAIVIMSGAVVPLNQFVHVAVTFDSPSKTITLYINGAPVASLVSLFSTINDNSEPLLIGAGDLGGNVRDFANAVIDEVEVFNRALSGTEIASLWAAGSDGKCIGFPFFVFIEPLPPPHPNVSGFAAALVTAASQSARNNRARAAAAAPVAPPAPTLIAPSTGTGLPAVTGLPGTGSGGPSPAPSARWLILGAIALVIGLSVGSGVRAHHR